MKAKSFTLYGKSHSTKDGFSLNGKLRLPSQGQNLGRSVTRTPFRGPLPRGNSNVSTNGRVVEIHRSSLGTPQTLVKRSTMNQSGMLEKRYTGILHGANANVYKIDKESSGYVHTVSKRVLECGIGIGGLLQSRYVKKEVGFTGCRPITKTILGMNYSQYNKYVTASCKLNGLVYKGINCCGGRTIGGSDNASTINKG